MSLTTGIYWVELGFINSYRDPQSRLVLLRYSADITSAFSCFVKYGIRTRPVTLCGLKDTTHKVDPNKNVRDLNEGECDAPI